jgi:hypothetical protein
MIALITSTIIPTNAFSLYDPDERLTQTKFTIEKLLNAGFLDIFLFDNSQKKIDVEELVKAYEHIKIFHSPQYTFKNKGLNEALLILNNVHHIPANIPIFKISGRYYPTSSFSKDIYDDYKENDFIGTGYNFKNRIADFSTKSYFVKNAEVLTSTLVKAVEDMISYSKGIHGVKSGFNVIKEIFKPTIGTQYQLSIEQSFARILKDNNKYTLLQRMNIEGYEATSRERSLFSE